MSLLPLGRNGMWPGLLTFPLPQTLKYQRESPFPQTTLCPPAGLWDFPFASHLPANAHNPSVSTQT